MAIAVLGEGVVSQDSIQQLLFSLGGDVIPAYRHALFTRIPRMMIRFPHSFTILPHKFYWNPKEILIP